MSSLLSTAVLCALVLLTARPTFAEEAGFGLEEGLMEPCLAKEENQRQVTALNQSPDTSQGCKDAVRRAMANCFPVQRPDQPVPSIESSGMLDGSTQQRNLYLQGESRLLSKAEICTNGRSEVNRACAEMVGGLRQAVHDNGVAAQEDAAELNSLPYSDSRVARVEAHRRYGEISQELQQQMHATSRLASSANKALVDGAQCNVNQAQMYAHGAAQVDRTLASIQGDGGGIEPHAEAITSTDAALSERVQQTGQQTVLAAASAQPSTGAAIQGALPNLAKGAKVVGKLGGAVSPIMSAVNGDAGGTIVGSATYATKLIYGGRVALGASGIGTFVMTALTPSELGHCDGIYSDPINAYQNNCALFVPQSPAANEAALHVLNHE